MGRWPAKPAGGASRQVGPDRVHHFAQVAANIRRRDCQHSIALGLEPRLPAGVVCPPRVVVVRRSVDFNYKSGGWAIEVNEVRPNGFLAPEPPALKLSSLQSSPDQGLGSAHRLPEASRDSRSACRHVATMHRPGSTCQPRLLTASGWSAPPSGFAGHLPTSWGGVNPAGPPSWGGVELGVRPRWVRGPGLLSFGPA